MADKEFSEEEIKLCDFLNKHAIIPSEDSKSGANKFTPDMISKIKELKLLPSDDYIIFPPCFVLLEYLKILDILLENHFAAFSSWKLSLILGRSDLAISGSMFSKNPPILSRKPFADLKK